MAAGRNLHCDETIVRWKRIDAGMSCVELQRLVCQSLWFETFPHFGGIKRV
jgi:hypothetical protein